MPDESAPATPEQATSHSALEEEVIDDLPVEQLTPEQQMARFEELLKEEDWGHQPC